MKTTVAAVAFRFVSQLVVGITHDALRSEVKRIHHENFFTFLHTRLIGFLLHQDLGTNEPCGNIVRIKREATINPLKGGIQIPRFTFKIG